MVMCFAPDCKHYSEKHGCRFFTFPKDDKLKKIWIKLLRRADREALSRVCSCHFKDEERENLPTLFLHNIDKKNLLIESPKRKKSRVMKSGPSSSDINASNNDTFSGMAELDVQKLDSNIDVHLLSSRESPDLLQPPIPENISGFKVDVSKIAFEEVSDHSYYQKKYLERKIKKIKPSYVVVMCLLHNVRVFFLMISVCNVMSQAYLHFM